MTAQPILLDTCALLHILTGSSVGLEIIKSHRLDERKDKPLVSTVSAGEMLAIITDRKWGEKKVEAAKELLRKFVLVPVNPGVIKDTYGDLMSFSKSKGFPRGQNDHWIAATASVTGAILVTNDKDFDGLHQHGKVVRVFHDPAPKPPPTKAPARTKAVRTKKGSKK